MNSRILILIVALLTTLAPVSGAMADEVLYGRYPALSPDGRTIAFTYQGDIWQVSSNGGRAERLTVHEADDIIPHYSPDGKWIMFSSRRFNNYDVFIISVLGGEPRQLTFDSDYDIGSGWFPASDSVLFTSYRDGRGDIFKVSIEGGMPVKLTGYAEEREYNGRLSADGQYLIFNNGSGPYRWWRRDLRTARNTDIYVADRAQAEFTSRRLTDFPNHDLWPILCESRGEVYFVSCRGDWGQVWMVPFTGGEVTQITSFNGDGVQWLNSNPQGSMLVFEQNFQIWVLDPANPTPRMVQIDISSDEHENLVERKSFTENVQWFAPSPDGKKIAAVVHGDIFVLPSEDPEEGIRITRTLARENFCTWDADSKTIYYCSDRDGNYDIFTADVSNGSETRVTRTPENEVKPIASPDGSYLAFYRGLDKIIRYDLRNARETVWAEGNLFDLGVETTMEYDWSPDSRWLVFTMAGPTYDTDIHVTSIDGRIENISKFAGWNFRPRFSADGKKVYFTCNLNDREDTYQIDLVHKPVEFYEARYDSLFLPEQNDKNREKEEIAAEPVTIDFNEIETRRSPAYRLPTSSEYPVLTPDGSRWVFVASVLGKPEVWSVNVGDDPDLTQLTHSGKGKRYLWVSHDSRYVFYVEGGVIKRCELDGGKVTSLEFTANMEIDRLESYRQKFYETWRMLADYFYDPTLRGVDWNAVRDKYAPLIEHIRTDAEFENLALEMMGELRGSHLDVYPVEPGPDANTLTGRLGIDFDFALLDREGVVRIEEILPESPAALAGVKLGQYLVAINGEKLDRNANLYRSLAGTIGDRVEITVADTPGGAESKLDVKPVKSAQIDNLWYENWVSERRRMVDSLSGGRLAYLHVRSMYDQYLERFEQELISIAEQKEGAIIDVRNNGGGHIAVHLLGALMRTPFVLRGFRDFPLTSENKLRSNAFERPLALLINNYSGSNSEIFAEGFRKLGLGKIIGEPTAGGVIGTSSYTLIDGTRVRRPSWGAFTTEMEDTDLTPRQPDIFVEDLPDDFINGRDPQLLRAVAELMKELR